jgi:uncharacterized LabA/DUF88 family protein
MEQITKEKIAIFIDGGNFYRRIRENGQFQKGVKFNYLKFPEYLARGRVVVLKNYYVGVVRNYDGSEKSQKMVESQQKFLSGLENDGYEVRRGKIVYDNKIREKGVDVQIAIDLVIGAVENIYDTAIVVSSDTDLIPAIKYVRSRGKKIEYVGFSRNPTIGMVKESDLSILLLNEDMKQFVLKKEMGLFDKN